MLNWNDGLALILMIDDLTQKINNELMLKAN